ncbi:MAG: DNA gyrase subunit A [Nitrospinota bacterium]
MAELQETRIPVAIEEEMKSSFMAYAMSVIIARALPDVRDGLKPVHRRILVTLNDLGLRPGRPYRKCAKIAGDVSGNYHPHGEAIVYPSLVRMAQGFSLRYPLVEGQGNFGSVDGDPPAAMRYTEARMTVFTEEMLADIEKETVDFVPNYDETLQEPVVLPSAIPNLVVNGSDGIAVGMATKVPPHNLGEVVDGLIALLDDSELPAEKLLKLVPGPDFPTGAIIHGRKGIRSAYLTGRGLIQVRANARVEIAKRSGREIESIVVTEIPYQVNKAKLIEKIADLVREKHIEGIADLRDESDRDGMRIVIELKRDGVSGFVLNQLYKHTPMQGTYGVILLALVNNQPRVLPLKDMLQHFIHHRREVVVRRTQYDLRKARERAHVLEGLLVALKHLDAVIKLIRGSRTADDARAGLMKNYRITQTQAQAILDMRLQRLVALEREKIQAEHKELMKTIARLEAVLADETLVIGIIKDELLEIKKKYADPRRTAIIEETSEITLEDMLVEEDVVVTISHDGYVKRTPLSLYRSQHRGGRGVKGMETRKDDIIEDIFVASTHDTMLFFTTRGRLHWLKVHQLPQAGRASRGKALVNLLRLEDGEAVSAALRVREFSEGKHVLMVTRKGVVKKTPLSMFGNPRAGGIIAIGLAESDELVQARITDGTRQVFLGTRQGKAIRFEECQVRPMGRNAAGVRGISLAKGDEIIGAEVVTPESVILSVTEEGYGKRTAVRDYRLTSRGGKGVINLKITEKNGPVVRVREMHDTDEYLLVTASGQSMRASVGEIPVIGRATQGVRLMRLDEGDKVVSIARPRAEEREPGHRTNGSGALPDGRTLKPAEDGKATEGADGASA